MADVGNAEVVRGKQEPSFVDFSYGSHEQQVMDIWLAESETPTPLVLFIHGGGFRNGSKSNFSAEGLHKFLDAGISLAALEYRFVQHKRLPAAHHDCRYAFQLIRSKADEWNLDKTRVGAFGGSAGAQICMWLGFHDDMANPNSDEVVERESTRLTCVATRGGQTTMDFDWWMGNIPGYGQRHRNPFETFDAKNEDELGEIVQDVSALSLISADDPPIFMSYGMSPDDPIPEESDNAQGWKVHHVHFGFALKKEMDALGIESHVVYPGAEWTYDSLEDFLIDKLTGDR